MGVYILIEINGSKEFYERFYTGIQQKNIYALNSIDICLLQKLHILMDNILINVMLINSKPVRNFIPSLVLLTSN
jgi:hypothetical protein